jgi:hypothetical protein
MLRIFSVQPIQEHKHSHSICPLQGEWALGLSPSILLFLSQSSLGLFATMARSCTKLPPYVSSSDNSRFFSQGKNSCHLRNEKPNKQNSYMAAWRRRAKQGPWRIVWHPTHSQLWVKYSEPQLFTVCWLLTSFENLNHPYTNYSTSLYLCLSGWLYCITIDGSIDQRAS